MLKRVFARASIFWALLAILAIITGLAIGLLGYLAQAESVGVRAEIASTLGPDAGLVVTLPRDDNPTAQDGLVRKLLANQLSRSGREVPVAIDRSVVGVDPVRLAANHRPGSLAAPRALVSSIPKLRSRATLEAGRWPHGPLEVSVQADAAAQLGLAPGDSLALGGALVTVTGTWRVDNPLDPRWLGDPFVTAGSDSGVAGPIVISETEWTHVGIDSLARWNITPVASEFRADDIGPVVAGWNNFRWAARQSGELDISSIDQAGGLATTLNEVQSRVTSLQAVGPVSLLVTFLCAFVIIVELARLLAGARSAESRLLWSRGATIAALARSTALEVAVVGLLGSTIGSAVAAAMLFAFGGPGAVLGAGAALWLVPVAIVASTIAVFAAVTVLMGPNKGRDRRPRKTGRMPLSMAQGIVILLCAGAAICVWQLLLYGSPLTPSASGGLQVDPVAVLAPALALLALVFLSLLSFSLFASRWERRAARSRSLHPALVSRTLSRSIWLAAAPFVVCALAFGQVVIAAGYAATWDRSFTNTSELRAGAAMRVSGAGGEITDQIENVAAKEPGVSAVVPVYLGTAGVGSVQASLVGIAGRGLASVATKASQALNPKSLASALSIHQHHITLPVKARSIQIQISTGHFPTPPTISALVSDPMNLLRVIPLTLKDNGRYAGSLPPMPVRYASGWRVAGFQIEVPDNVSKLVNIDHPATFAITSATVDGSTPINLAFDWSPAWLGADQNVIAGNIDGAGFTVDAGGGPVRIFPTLGHGSDDLTVPIAVSQALADSSGIKVGDLVIVSMDPEWSDVPCSVAVIIPAIPGAPDDNAAMADLDFLQGMQLRASAPLIAPAQLWIGSSHPKALASSLRRSLPVAVGVEALGTDPRRVMLSAPISAFWIGAAGAALLALVAVIAVSGVQLRSRRRESSLLRALGVSVAEIAKLRRIELAVILAAGAVVGVIAGLAVSALTLPALARAAVIDPYPNLATGLGFDVASLALGLVVTVAVLLCVVFAYGRRVRTQLRQLVLHGAVK